METINHVVPIVSVEKSFNIKQGMGVYFARLNQILTKIINGCDNFDSCPICQCDYSIQFLDIAVCILYKDEIIDKETKQKIISKLYNGHRG